MPGRLRLQAFVVWSAVSLFACGEDGAPIAPLTQGPRNNDTDAGIDKGNGPLVEIIDPPPANDPTEDEVLTGGTVTVRCRVEQRPGGTEVDPASVVVKAFSGEELVEPASMTAASAKGENIYEAEVSMGNVATGRVTFLCSATDLDKKMPREGRDIVKSLYDRGPQIEFVALNDESVVALGNDESPDVTIQFSVLPSPVTENDPEAEVGEVKLDIDGIEVKPKFDRKTNTYLYPLDFASLFGGVPITAAGVTVRATNKRTPKPVQVSKTIGLTVDGAGPSIRVLSPVSSSGAPIVGARVDVQLEIRDDVAGVVVDPEKLYASISYRGEEYVYPLEAKGGNNYTFTFFAARFSETANVTANIRAQDRAGNVSTASHTMLFDTVPPYVTLMPPDLVYAAKLPLGAGACVGGFDPVGRHDISTAPRDGQIVELQIRPRAVIWERAIEPRGATEYWYSGVDNTSTTLYFMEANKGPLLLDEVADENGYCDTVSSNAQQHVLSVVKPAGSPLIGRLVNQDGSQVCEVPTNVKQICDGAGLFYVLKHSMEGGDSVVYSTNPRATGVGCAGTSVDLNTAPGWVCMVAAASDKAGNVAFSEPVRVCRYTKEGDCPGVPGDIVTPPPEFTCTDGCTLPPIMSERPFPTDEIIPQP